MTDDGVRRGCSRHGETECPSPSPMNVSQVTHKLPPKILFGNYSEKVTKEREKQLQSYVNGMLKDGNLSQKSGA